MIIAFFSNYLNHHQIPFAEAMNDIDGVDFIFVAVSGVPEFRKKLGYIEYNKPYLLDLTKSNSNKEKAIRLSIEADVVIFVSSGMEHYIIPRLKLGKMTFEYSERWLKRKYKLNLLSPRLWRHQLMYYKYGRNNKLYMLCSSAYAANDYYFLHSYKNKCFKWAYYPKVEDLDIKSLLSEKRGKKTQIMWCSRFIKWKHPELAIKAAKKLIAEGYVFDLNMYGNGPLLESTQKMLSEQGLTDFIHIKGNAPNQKIIEAMQRHHIFLFSSDQNEGWGAVANEAMSNGCAIIGSNMIGSIPYLVRDEENGLIFKSEDVQSLYLKLKKLLDNPELCEKLALQSYFDMKRLWSPQVAADRFISLIDHLSKGLETPFIEGPCSKAIPTKQ